MLSSWPEEWSCCVVSKNYTYTFVSQNFNFSFISQKTTVHIILQIIPHCPLESLCIQFPYLFQPVWRGWPVWPRDWQKDRCGACLPKTGKGVLCGSRSVSLVCNVWEHFDCCLAKTNAWTCAIALRQNIWMTLPSFICSSQATLHYIWQILTETWDLYFFDSYVALEQNIYVLRIST